VLSLCDTSDQKKHLAWLAGHLSANPQVLNGTQAWTVFSSKASTVKLSGKAADFQVSKEQRASFKAIKEATVKHLLARCGRACAYCRRPVGHYGYGWHIEHVKAKSADWRGTFDLANLVVGCVDCNYWKAARVDRASGARAPSIISPAAAGFSYPDHFRFVQLCTESLAFAKYLIQGAAGQATYDALRFDLIERCTAIDRLDAKSASLHERLSRVLTHAADDPEQAALVALLGKLRDHIYRAP
jgi:hypothetical protein